MLCPSGNKPSPQVFWSSPARLKMRIDPLPSTATDRGKFHTSCPRGGAPKNVTSYLPFVVWEKAAATRANTTKIMKAYSFMQTFLQFEHVGATASSQVTLRPSPLSSFLSR